MRTVKDICGWMENGHGAKKGKLTRTEKELLEGHSNCQYGA